jgi:hypothetical protein
MRHKHTYRKQHYNKPHENESWVMNNNLNISCNVRIVTNALVSEQQDFTDG